jgi:aryl-alcohol dehydrogenase-like predicted oxidoreductase
MQYRTLGKSGLMVSTIGLGTNQFGGKVDEAAVSAILDTAIDLGVNLIDTADVYQSGRSEETLGKALKNRRQQVILATKVYNPTGDGPNDRSASRHHILEAVDASLHRLHTDYIDLYQIHNWDPITPIEETLRALEDLLRSGRVRYIGASNFLAWQLTWANALAELRGWSRFVSVQPHYHMLERAIESELIPACQYFGIGILPYFPLAGGFLTGKYRLGQPPPPGSRGESSQYVRRYMTDANFHILAGLEQYASARGRSLTGLAHAWLLSRPMVASVISGVTRPDQVHLNVADADWDLSTVEASEIERLLTGS